MHSVVQSVRLLGVEASAIKARDYEIYRSPVRFLVPRGAIHSRPNWEGRVYAHELDS